MTPWVIQPVQKGDIARRSDQPPVPKIPETVVPVKIPPPPPSLPPSIKKAKRPSSPKSGTPHIGETLLEASRERQSERGVFVGPGVGSAPVKIPAKPTSGLASQSGAPTEPVSGLSPQPSPQQFSDTAELLRRLAQKDYPKEEPKRKSTTAVQPKGKPKDTKTAKEESTTKRRWKPFYGGRPDTGSGRPRRAFFTEDDFDAMLV